MKLLDLQEKRYLANNIYMAYFMEGTMPTQTQLDAMDIQDVMNNCLTMRPYLHAQYGTGGRTIMQPMSRYDAPKNWPLYSAWQEVDTVYGKQVLPKTKVRRYRDLNIESLYPSMQITNMFSMVAMGRITDPQTAANLLYITAGVYTPDVDPADATKSIVAEFDFGADVEISGYMKICSSSGVAANALHQVTLQAQLAGVWTDVSALITPSTPDGTDTTIYPITYTGAKVVARYFRLRKSSLTTQVYPGTIRFMGKYVSGSPRTFGKIGYMIMTPFARSNSVFDPNCFNSNSTCNSIHTTQYNVMDDRQVAMNAYSVTDDPKQIANFDLFLPNGLDFEQGTDLYPPFFTTVPPIIELEAL